MNKSILGLYYEDFVVGEEIKHSLSKTIFESDNNFFSLLTMNHHPVHTNIDYAAKNQHGKILVVGTLVFSLAVGITVPDVSGKAIANLGYENIKHLNPVFLNDTIYVRTKVLDKRESKTKADRGVVYVESVAYNQNGVDVLSFRRNVLVKKEKMNETYLMRSLMFVPAHNKKLLESSIRRDADILLLDIEDSVPYIDKQTSRDNIKEFSQRKDLNGKLLFPRVNDRESGELLKDVYQLTIDGIAGFMYPKSTKGEDVYFFGKLLETIEYEKGYPIGTFKIIPLIETTGAVMNLNEICDACPNRVIAIAFGCEDYVTDLQGKHDTEGISIMTARSLISVAARAHGIIPIDTVHIRINDLEDLERNLKIGKNLGYEGMMVLNPKELPLVHKYYSPSKEEVDWATEMIQLSEEAVKDGKGVAVKDDKFIGPPMVKMAKKIIEKNEKIKKKENI
jgi:Citrate lyase beta subunit